MEKEPEKEIMVEPGWSILEDGLGYQVLAVNGFPTIDKDGRQVIIWTIKPDEKVRKRYNWRGGAEIDDQGNKKITTNKIDLVPLNLYDDANRKWMYVKSFNHDETELSQRERVLKMEMERLRKENSQLDAENIRLNEVIELLRTNPGKYLSMSSEYFQEMMKGVSKLGLGKKEE